MLPSTDADSGFVDDVVVATTLEHKTVFYKTREKTKRFHAKKLATKTTKAFQCNSLAALAILVLTICLSISIFTTTSKLYSSATQAEATEQTAALPRKQQSSFSTNLSRIIHQTKYPVTASSQQPASSSLLRPVTSEFSLPPQLLSSIPASPSLLSTTLSPTKTSRLAPEVNKHHNFLDVSIDDFIPQLNTMGDFISLGCSIAMIFGGLVPYIPQYIKIRRTLNSDGFSTYAFWFGHHFEPPLLIQSFVMIAAMLALMQLCVRVKDKEMIYGRPRRFCIFDFHFIDFWQWDDFLSYLEFLGLFSLLLGLLTYVLINNEIYIESLGFLALITESLLGTPQLITNYKKRSTLGMSVAMVAMWLVGDVLKTVYFLQRDAPKQFWICGYVQVIIDMLILGQVLFYRRRHSVMENA